MVSKMLLGCVLGAALVNGGICEASLQSNLQDLTNAMSSLANQLRGGSSKTKKPEVPSSPTTPSGVTTPGSMIPITLIGSSGGRGATLSLLLSNNKIASLTVASAPRIPLMTIMAPSADIPAIINKLKELKTGAYGGIMFEINNITVDKSKGDQSTTYLQATIGNSPELEKAILQLCPHCKIRTSQTPVSIGFIAYHTKPVGVDKNKPTQQIWYFVTGVEYNGKTTPL